MQGAKATPVHLIIANGFDSISAHSRFVVLVFHVHAFNVGGPLGYDDCVAAYGHREACGRSSMISSYTCAV